MSSDSEHEGHRPPKRARTSSSPGPNNKSTNGHGHGHPPESNSSSSPSPSMRPLSLSILGVEPLDEFIREIADFIHHMIHIRPDGEGHVEVEAKVGILKDKHTGQRVQLPVLVETILTPNSLDSRFESNMSPAQHKHFNTILNNLKTFSTQPGHTSAPLEYQHLHLVDTFYQPDSTRDKDKIRVTRDEKSGAVLACMQKVRLGNLDVYSPKRAADWRISVNMEIPVPPPLGTASLTRKKDRVSYSHEEFTVDLTQVTSTAGPNTKPEVLHELELEVTRPDYLLSTASKRGDPKVSETERNAFDELIRAFVNNARILVRNAGEGWQ